MRTIWVMILVTHAVAGSAVALLVRSNPVLAFLAAIASHFVLDAIPHWHYPLRSWVKDQKSETGWRFTRNRKRFFADVLATGLDCGLGFAIAAIAVSQAAPHWLGTALLGAAGGVLPDFFHLLYYFFPTSVLKYLERFHIAVHATERLDERHALGIGSQLAILIVFAFQLT